VLKRQENESATAKGQTIVLHSGDEIWVTKKIYLQSVLLFPSRTYVQLIEMQSNLDSSCLRYDIERARAPVRGTW
jgi:hypothetical protein